MESDKRSWAVHVHEKVVPISKIKVKAGISEMIGLLDEDGMNKFLRSVEPAFAEKVCNEIISSVGDVFKGGRVPDPVAKIAKRCISINSSLASSSIRALIPIFSAGDFVNNSELILTESMKIISGIGLFDEHEIDKMIGEHRSKVTGLASIDVKIGETKTGKDIKIFETVSYNERITVLHCGLPGFLVNTSYPVRMCGKNFSHVISLADIKVNNLKLFLNPEVKEAFLQYAKPSLAGYVFDMMANHVEICRIVGGFLDRVAENCRVVRLAECGNYPSYSVSIGKTLCFRSYNSLMADVSEVASNSELVRSKERLEEEAAFIESEFMKMLGECKGVIKRQFEVRNLVSLCAI